MVSQRIRRMVYDRDGGVCVHCGTPSTLTIQHRASKGMGGSKLMDNPANLLTLCLHSNTRLEHDADFAKLGRAMGWKLNRWENPEDVSIIYPDGNRYYIDNHGNRTIKETDNG